MKNSLSLTRLATALALVMMVWRAAAAAVPAELVQSDGVTFGIRRPATGPAPHVAVIYENGAGGINHPMCTAMAERGFLTVCAIQRNGEGTNAWESVALDVKALVQYARRQTGITRVVIYGHSGGGAVGSFYQAVAENGVAFCQDPRKFTACDSNLANLPAADGILFADAHPGLAVMALRNVNPSVSSDGRKLRVDAALDPFNPKNGFNPSGPSHYSREFQDKYTRAQAAGMDRLIEQAQSIRKQIAAGTVDDPIADQVQNLAAGVANNLAALDPDIAGILYTTQPRRLLRGDGSIMTQPIRSATVGSPELARAGLPSIRSSAQVLSRGSVRARDSIADMDVCTSNANTSCNVRSIHVPVLFIPAGAYEFIADNERMYEGSVSRDKEFIVNEGALHSGAPCTRCEKTPGQYANSEKNQYDYMRDWINKRF